MQILHNKCSLGQFCNTNYQILQSISMINKDKMVLRLRIFIMTGYHILWLITTFNINPENRI